MGYLTLSTDQSVTKITFAFWFRVTPDSLAASRTLYQEQLDAYFADDTGSVPPPAGNSGLVPLISFGKRSIDVHDLVGIPFADRTVSVEVGSGSFIDYIWDCEHCAWLTSGAGPELPVFDNHGVPIRASGSLCDNSMLCVNVRGDRPVFDFRFQYDWSDGPPAVAGIDQLTHYSISPDPAESYLIPGFCSCLPPHHMEGDLYIPDPEFVGDIHHVNSEIGYDNWASQPELLAGYFSVPVAGYGTSVSAGGWHHALFSLDISSGTVSTLGTQSGDFAAFDGEITAAVKAYFAIDDVNRTGHAISEAAGTFTRYDGQTAAAGPNDLLTTLGLNTLARTNGVNDAFQSGKARPSYDFTLPSFSLENIFIPGDDLTTQRIEMAELYVFTGVSVDPANEATRRLFVTPTGTPAPPADARAALGRPAIALQGTSSNWIHGINTGTLGDLSSVGTINPVSSTVRL